MTNTDIFWILCGLGIIILGLMGRIIIKYLISLIIVSVYKLLKTSNEANTVHPIMPLPQWSEAPKKPKFSDKVKIKILRAQFKDYMRIVECCTVSIDKRIRNFDKAQRCLQRIDEILEGDNNAYK